MAAALALEQLDKRYGAVHAVEDVSVAFEAGRLHAVVGENGAGKSTLLKMAAGIVTPDRGRVLVRGEPLAPHTASEAIRRGVGMVQQHFALVPVLTALDNVMLGAEPVRGLRLDRPAARARAEAVAQEMGVTVPWDAPVEALGVGDRQRLEIVRTLVREAKVVILDEPTAVLTKAEAERLYATLRRLVDGGRAVVVVTHRLDEVREHADDVTVLRRGRRMSSGRLPGRGADAVHALTREIMGGEPPAPAARTKRTSRAEPVLAVRDVAVGRLDGVSFEVRAGEVVGVAGVEGNGQRELVRVLAGLDATERGQVTRGAGRTVVVHEDRHAEGLVLGASVRDNLLLGELSRFTRPSGLIDREAAEREAGARMRAAGVVPPDLDATAVGLSGGNQQKIVVARAVARSQTCDALVFAQPTRGVDLGAARAIHQEILATADAGKGVLVVSADLDELRALSDRILVLFRGRIVQELPRDASDEVLGEAMLGVGAIS